MRITQGYVSKSIMDFPFHQIYRLNDYNDSESPAVFFGMYRYEDYCLFRQHYADDKIFWTGQDALTFDWTKSIFGSTHVTAHPKVAEWIRSKGHQCELVKPSSFLNDVNTQQLGSRIYAYCPQSAPDYHGIKIIRELEKRGYDIIIGKGDLSQEEWRNKWADQYYQPCYIGLCLSEFAGGGTSIIEMGLRGMPVVTNVFNLPNCIPWQTIEDVVNAIEQHKSMIGHTNDGVAKLVYGELDHDFKWLEL